MSVSTKGFLSNNKYLRLFKKLNSRRQTRVALEYSSSVDRRPRIFETHFYIQMLIKEEYIRNTACKFYF